MNVLFSKIPDDDCVFKNLLNVYFNYQIMHKLKRLFKRKRPSPTKNEDCTAKKARNEHLNITIIENGPAKKTKKNHKIQRFLQKLISRSNYDHAQLAAYRKANESIRTSNRRTNGDQSTTEISIIGDETIGEKSLFEGKLIFCC